MGIGRQGNAKVSSTRSSWPPRGEQASIAADGCPDPTGVENNTHHARGTAFEDDRPWIESSPRGMLVVVVLRRLAYNLLTLFRSVTQRFEQRRGTPWLDLLGWVYNALIAASDEDVASLRPRARAP